MNGGIYNLTGTIGQAEPGTLGGGIYTLSGSFLTGTESSYRVYLPLDMRGP
jgi:hypothetical protein